MSAEPQAKPCSLVIDKQRVRYLADKMNKRIGFVPDPTATALQAQEQLLQSGVNPEDNELSCEIIRVRERNRLSE